MLHRISFWLFGLCLCLLLAGWNQAKAETVRIADGDCVGLASAVSAAQTAVEATTILLARKGTYSNCDINFVASGSPLLLDAAGARLDSPRISVAGPFTLRNAWITAASGGAARRFACTLPNDVTSVAVMCLRGTVTLDTVTVSDLPVPVNTGAVIEGQSGDVLFRNFTMANLGLTSDGTSTLRDGTSGIVLGTNVKGAIVSSTIAHINFVIIPAGLNGAVMLLGAAVRVGNSVFQGGAWGCAGRISSDGGNVSDSYNCLNAASDHDKYVATADFAFGSLDYHGGLVPTLAINGGSAAKGAGIAANCEALDARGYTRSPNGCDAGAYEYGGGSGGLTASGLNGFYFDANANGHYVSMQRIHDNGDIAIVWSTFDSKGNQAWIYGVGQLTDHHIHAGMSQNVGGVLQPGSGPTGSSVRPWGTVDIDLTSCALAQFSYASSLDGFGSGTFPLTRLAFVSDFGCSE